MGPGGLRHHLLDVDLEEALGPAGPTLLLDPAADLGQGAGQALHQAEHLHNTLSGQHGLRISELLTTSNSDNCKMFYRVTFISGYL